MTNVLIPLSNWVSLFMQAVKKQEDAKLVHHVTKSTMSYLSFPWLISWIFFLLISSFISNQYVNKETFYSFSLIIQTIIGSPFHLRRSLLKPNDVFTRNLTGHGRYIPLAENLRFHPLHSFHHQIWLLLSTIGAPKYSSSIIILFSCWPPRITFSRYILFRIFFPPRRLVCRHWLLKYTNGSWIKESFCTQAPYITR